MNDIAKRKKIMLKHQQHHLRIFILIWIEFKFVQMRICDADINVESGVYAKLARVQWNILLLNICTK